MKPPLTQKITAQRRPKTAPNNFRPKPLHDNGDVIFNYCLNNNLILKHFMIVQGLDLNIGIKNRLEWALEKYHSGKNMRLERIKHFMVFKRLLKPIIVSLLCNL